MMQLTPNSVVLTATQRLARYLCQQYETQPVLISTWQNWFVKLYKDHLANDRIVLSPNQELLIWQTVVLKSPWQMPIAIAHQVQQAWQLICQWNIPLVELKLFELPEVQALLSWIDEFQLFCTANNWIDQARVLNFLAEPLQANNLSLPSTIYLAGFDEYPPQLQRLIQTFKSHCKIEALPSHQLAESKRSVLAATEVEQEIYQMARWAKYQLQNGITNIGCIVTNLTSLYSKLEKAFRRVFANMPNSFEFSLGKTLSEYPIISYALFFIKLNSQPLNPNELNHLLQSPFLTGSRVELTNRALLAAKLNERGGFSITLTELAKAAHANNCPLLATALSHYLTHQADLNAQFTPKEWVTYFSQQLTALGWPYSQNLTSLEYQAITRWQNLLNEYAELTAVIAKQTLAEAIATLKQLASSIIFQPESMNAPIQIMGALETAGLDFNMLWVMGCDDEQWPPANNQTNPFIPIALQKKHDIPPIARTPYLNFYSKVTRRLARSAPEIIFSYAMQNKEKILQPSIFIKPLAKIDAALIPQAEYTPPHHKLFSKGATETVLDGKGIPLNGNLTAKGGTSIFKDQAACPFRSYVKHRLRAQALPKPQLGFNKKQRGILVHAILEQFWQTIRSQQELKKYNDTQLTDLIKTKTHACLTKFINTHQLAIDKHIFSLEHIYLTHLLLNWLTQERERPEFAVLATEKRQTIQFNGLSINVQIDRIDQLANGNQLIIDYKTSKQLQRSHWLGKRLAEPQLPLYCIANKDSADGIAFAVIHHSNMQFIGITAQESMHDVKTVTELKEFAEFSNWSNLVNEWEKNLMQLAVDFQQGKADRDPKDGQQTCATCDLHSVCRIHEESE